MVVGHSCDQAFAEVLIKKHRIIGEHILAKRQQGVICCSRIAFGQSAQEPTVSDASNCVRVFRAERFDDLMQRAGVRLPIQID